MQPPTVFVLGVNNFCNLYCRMCDVGTGHSDTNFGANLLGSDNKMMSLDLCKKTLDQIAEWSPGAAVAFVYTEPLAWPPIAAAVAYATEMGLRPQVTTNGLLLSRHAEALVNAGCQELVISIDGPSKIHDFIRRKKGSYDKALDGVAQVRRFDPTMPITVSCAITQWNAGHLAQLAEDLIDSQITQIIVVHNQFTDGAVAAMHTEKYPWLAATASNVFESDVTEIDLEVLQSDLDRLGVLDLPYTLKIVPELNSAAKLKTYYQDPGQFVGTRCDDPFRIMMIDSDGEVIPAHGRCFRFPIGNINDIPLKSMWNAKGLKDLRKSLNDAGGLLPACARCCGGVT